MTEGYSLAMSDGEKKAGNTKKVVCAIAIIGVILVIIGIALIIAGAVMLGKCKRCEDTTTKVPSTASPDANFSAEARRVGLGPFLEEVKSAYYKMNPKYMFYNPGTASSTTSKVFVPFNCHPRALKQRTDSARSLYERSKKMSKEIDPNKLTARELKALAQVQHFLKSTFGAPFDENYYAGDWLLGPNLFCWQTICGIGGGLIYHFNLKSNGFQPANEKDLEFVMDHLKNTRDYVTQYIKNLKYGIQAGFVRSVEECKAGLSALKGKYKTVAKEGEKGILNASYVKEMRNVKWYSKVSVDTQNSWKNKHGKDVQKSIDDSLIEHVGRPLHNLLQYLEFNHSQHCVPSNVSSGLANLPLDYVYFNGIKTSEKTTKVLPFGEQLSGKKAYEMILPYFTTTSMSPDEVNDLGWKMLNQLYPQAIAIAKKITGLDDKDQAVVEFQKKLEDQSMYFNDNSFPKNESNKEAFSKCVDMASAEKHCPARYASMLKWFSFTNEVVSKLASVQVHMFHYTGLKQSTPNCPLKMVANFNPSVAYEKYVNSDRQCSQPCRFFLPFFVKNHGPKYGVYTTTAHEAIPGHHTQYQGFIELFSDNRVDVISWMDGIGFYNAFTEGWGLYAENPLISSETNVYDKLPLQRYGMLKYQIWRALRLICDTGLHYKGMTRDEALELFAKYAWDKTDRASKEVTRYQSGQGQATGYMIGQLAIWKYRNATEKRLQANGKKFNEKDFHFQVLSQGSAPLSYLETHLQKFTNCTIDPKGSGCDKILNPGIALRRVKREEKLMTPFM